MPRFPPEVTVADAPIFLSAWRCRGDRCAGCTPHGLLSSFRDRAGGLLRRVIPDGSGAMDARLAVVSPVAGQPDAILWFHTDHQGSVIATSDAAGQPGAMVNYSPQGEFGTDVNGDPITGDSVIGFYGPPRTVMLSLTARFQSLIGLGRDRRTLRSCVRLHSTQAGRVVTV